MRWCLFLLTAAIGIGVSSAVLFQMTLWMIMLYVLCGIGGSSPTSTTHGGGTCPPKLLSSVPTAAVSPSTSSTPGFSSPSVSSAAIAAPSWETKMTRDELYICLIRQVQDIRKAIHNIEMTLPFLRGEDGKEKQTEKESPPCQ